MEIAIYGNSYGVNKIFNDKKDWITHLKHYYSVTNYCTDAASLDYCFHQYLNTKDHYQIKIFIIPPNNSYWIKGYQNEDLFLYNNKKDFEKFLEILKKENKLRSIFALQSAAISYNFYLKYLDGENKNNFYYELILEEIKNLEDNTLFIESKDFDAISAIDYERFHITKNEVNIDKRLSKMNQINNKIFAEKIINWINTKEINLSVKYFEASIEPQHDLFELC